MPKGDGITKRKDGLYMARYTVHTPDGPKRKTIYSRKYKEVEKKVAEAKGDAAKGIYFDDENMAVSEYITRWLEDSAKGHLAPASYRNYELQIRRHIVPALGSLKLSKLTAAYVQSLYAAKLRDGMKPASVATGKGTPYDYQTVTTRHFKPLLKRAGLPDIRFHDLRHTYATLLLGRGTHPTYVQKSLGHANIAMTLDRYSHWMPSMGRATADGIDAALG
jgi:integrase